MEDSKHNILMQNRISALMDTIQRHRKRSYILHAQTGIKEAHFTDILGIGFVAWSFHKRREELGVWSLMLWNGNKKWQFDWKQSKAYSYLCKPVENLWEEKYQAKRSWRMQWCQRQRTAKRVHKGEGGVNRSIYWGEGRERIDISQERWVSICNLNWKFVKKAQLFVPRFLLEEVKLNCI